MTASKAPDDRILRYRYMASPLARTVVQVIVGGALVFAIGMWLGRLGAGA